LIAYTSLVELTVEEEREEKLEDCRNMQRFDERERERDEIVDERDR